MKTEKKEETIYTLKDTEVLEKLGIKFNPNWKNKDLEWGCYGRTLVIITRKDKKVQG